MDWVTLAVGIGLMALGAVVTWYPMHLLLTAANQKLQIEKAKNRVFKKLATRSITVERRIANARDLEPLDEFGVLLDTSDIVPGPGAPDEPGVESGSLDGDGGDGNPAGEGSA